jgi:hypothetical protein
MIARIPLPPQGSQFGSSYIGADRLAVRQCR